MSHDERKPMLWGPVWFPPLPHCHSIHEIIASALVGWGDGLADFTGQLYPVGEGCFYSE